MKKEGSVMKRTLCYVLVIFTFLFAGCSDAFEHQYILSNTIWNRKEDKQQEGIINSSNLDSDSNTNTDSQTINYASVEYLSLKFKTFNKIVGESFKYAIGTASNFEGEPSTAPPYVEFCNGYIHVVAKVVEEYPGTYETLNTHGSIRTKEYRLFRMKVVDPLESKLDGEFLYILPKGLKGDLAQYDSLLLSMRQLPKNYVLKYNDKLTAFEYLFTDPIGHPELGNIIAFSNSVFDETLWQDRSWIYGYQFSKQMLDRGDEWLIVSRGSTLEDVLVKRKARIKKNTNTIIPEVYHYEFQTKEANAAFEHIVPFKNGVFVPNYSVQHSANYTYYRYINGCPTNEWISINRSTEKVTTSEFIFQDNDFENLPNISQYIQNIDLKKIAPPHIDTDGKLIIANNAVGWYEKTKDGVYSIVKIAWCFSDEDDKNFEYYDEAFILLDERGDSLVSRESLIELIGENVNISNMEYGAKIPKKPC